MALAVYRLRFDRREWAVAVVALAARLLLAPAGIVNGDLGGYEKLLFARGNLEDPPYGGAWGALMGWVPGWPDGVFVANLVLAVLAAPLVARAGRYIGEARVGVSAGLLMALLPVHLGVSRSETMHVSVLTFELLAVVAALGWARSRQLADGLLAALAAGFAVHLRPDALVFVPVPVLAALTVPARVVDTARRGALPLLTLAALVLARLVTLRPEGTGQILQLPAVDLLLPRLGEPAAERSFLVSLHLGLTPAPVLLLAVVGALVLLGGRRFRTLGLLLAWAALTTVPFGAKVYPLVDAIRLQLGGQAPLLLLAGIGAAAVPGVFTVFALLACLAMAPRPWVQTEEWGFARTLGARVGGEKIQFDPRHQRSRAWVAVMNREGPAVWTLEPAMVRYIGLTCLVDDGCDTSGCVTVASHTLEGKVDLDLPLRSRELALVRCPTP